MQVDLVCICQNGLILVGTKKRQETGASSPSLCLDRPKAMQFVPQGVKLVDLVGKPDEYIARGSYGEWPVKDQEVCEKYIEVTTGLKIATSLKT